MSIVKKIERRKRKVPMQKQIRSNRSENMGGTLSDMGERRILHEIIEKRFPASRDMLVPVGDDAAGILLSGTNNALLLTTDPCPIPVLWLLGEKDYFVFGWFSVLINASDLAAMGATPLGILLAVNARADMSIYDFEQFLDGVSQAASAFDCPVIGGNLKDAIEFSCVGTAVGLCQKDSILRRSGAQEGDLVVVIGDMGLFASSVLSRLHDITLNPSDMEKADRNLRRPIARVKEGQVLASKHLVTACMDSSDGLVNCFYEIALKSNVDIYLDLAKTKPDKIVDTVSSELGIDWRKILLMWGDWELACTVSPEKLKALGEEMRSIGTPYSVVGKVKSGHGKVFIKDGTRYRSLHKMDNERFSGSSYFTHTLEETFDMSNISLFE